MRFKTTRIVAAIAVIGAVAAGGAAFTDTTGQPSGQALGYGSTSITGGTVTGITYQMTSDDVDVNTITLATGTEDLETANNGALASVYLAFDGDGFHASGGQADATCVVQTGGLTTICTMVGTRTVASIQSVQIAITDGSTGDTFG
jgi:hypothetical protein